MNKILAIILILSTTGCASVDINPYRNMSTAEMGWQAMHFVDVGQTLSISKDSCFRETNSVTRKIVGKNPKASGVLIWGAGISYLHASGSQWLEKTDVFSDKFKKLIRIVDFGIKFDTIHNNYSIGLNFSTSDNRVDDLCNSM